MELQIAGTSILAMSLIDFGLPGLFFGELNGMPCLTFRDIALIVETPSPSASATR